MPIEFTCPHCGATTKVADEYMGAPGVRPSSSSSNVWIIVLVVCVIGFIPCSGILVALLLPAVQAAREAARRVECSNNLKQIGLAMHNYHDAWGDLPPAYTVDEDGNRLHSWRTLILPFMEQQPLYEQIRLDEPWNSEHNQRIADTVVQGYNCPSNPSPGTNTHYMSIVGEEAMFRGAEPTSFADIRDGTSNTLMIVEVKESTTPWMEPVDLDMEDMQMKINSSPSDMGSWHPGGGQAVLGDGAVRFLSETIDPKTLRALVTRDGRENIGDF